MTIGKQSKATSLEYISETINFIKALDQKS